MIDRREIAKSLGQFLDMNNVRRSNSCSIVLMIYYFEGESPVTPSLPLLPPAVPCRPLSTLKQSLSPHFSGKRAGFLPVLSSSKRGLGFFLFPSSLRGVWGFLSPYPL
jgi:hypothetical protein